MTLTLGVGDDANLAGDDLVAVSFAGASSVTVTNVAGPGTLNYYSNLDGSADGTITSGNNAVISTQPLWISCSGGRTTVTITGGPY